MTDIASKILIFGCGNMGGAMLRGWIAGGVEANRFVVVDPFANELPESVAVHRTAAEVTQPFETVLLGIKPQMIGELAPQIAPLLMPDALVVSILAGTTTATLSNHFPTSRVVRLMPNLAAAIGKSPLGLWSSALDEVAAAELNGLLSPLGTPVWLTAEDQMNAVTALAGSGPAFVYRFIDALSTGGAKLGLPPETASRFALAMVEGAVLLALQSDNSPAELADKVTSPGGTTAAGLAILDDDDALGNLVESTLRAATERGGQLAHPISGDET